MRRQLRRALPELAHWFGLRPADIDAMPHAEVDEFVKRLKHLPPIGGTRLFDAERR